VRLQDTLVTTGPSAGPDRGRRPEQLTTSSILGFPHTLITTASNTVSYSRTVNASSGGDRGYLEGYEG